MDYHPLFDLTSVFLLIVITAGFTPPSSFLRIACLPVLTCLTWHCVSRCPDYFARSSWASAVGGYTTSSLLHYVDVVLLNRWSFDAQGPAKNGLLVRGASRVSGGSAEPQPRAAQPSYPPPGAKARLMFGVSVFFSWRFINTPYQVRNVPTLDAKLHSRRRFLLDTGLTIIVCYLILDAMNSSQNDDYMAEEFYSLDKIGLFSRIREVTLRELVMRFFAAVGLGAGLVSFQRGVYSIAAFVCVAARLSSPLDWPPFNGPISRISSLRYFWSIFWHQINSHRLDAMANYVIHDVCRLRRGGRPARYIRPCMIFLISGLWHVVIDVSSGISMQDSGALPFFLIQPLGIFIEDLVRSRGLTKAFPSVVQSCFGFLWVGLWMAWTAPAYLYPIINASKPGDGVVPFSIIGYVKGRLE